MRQLSFFAPRAEPATPYVERRREDGALLPPAAEIPAYWLDPREQDWIPVEDEKNAALQER